MCVNAPGVGRAAFRYYGAHIPVGDDIDPGCGCRPVFSRKYLIFFAVGGETAGAIVKNDIIGMVSFSIPHRVKDGVAS